MNVHPMVGDKVLVEGEITSIHIYDKKNIPEYVVRIKCYGQYESTTVNVKEEVILIPERSGYKEIRNDRIIRICNKCGYFLHGYEEDGKLKFDNYCPNCGKKVENEQAHSQEKDDTET